MIRRHCLIMPLLMLLLSIYHPCQAVINDRWVRGSRRSICNIDYLLLYNAHNKHAAWCPRIHCAFRLDLFLIRSYFLFQEIQSIRRHMHGIRALRISRIWYIFTVTFMALGHSHDCPGPWNMYFFTQSFMINSTKRGTIKPHVPSCKIWYLHTYIHIYYFC